MDPVGLVITGAGGWLLARLAEPSAKEIGEVLATPVKRWAERRHAVLESAGNRLQAAGVEPRQIADDVWAPLLQYAGLSDDAQMRETWAALLANAADPRQPPVLPSFPEVLRQLTPLDARVLAGVYEVLVDLKLPQDRETMHGALATSISPVLGASDKDVVLAIENLVRLNLVSTPASGFEFVEQKHHRYQLQNRDILCGTPFGWAFIQACGGPKKP